MASLWETAPAALIRFWPEPGFQKPMPATCGAVPLQPIDRIVGNQVHLRADAAGVAGEDLGLV